MEFQFNINEYFKEPVVQIRNTLLPPDFAGDRRALWNTVNKVAEIVNEMGEASAHAQGLSKPITTAERLRQSDQSLYLLVDKDENNGNGAVTGMLKVGRKGLYVFDREGQHYQVTPPCVLDFYVHEKRQRSGLGRKLFEHMLEIENVKPHNMAIDRPSEKFLNFLKKHYSLHNPIRQMNNYVVFDGFFPEYRKEEQSERSPINRTNGLQSTYSPNTPSYGRYGAPRPPCSMGQIIHNTSSQKNTEPASQNKFFSQQENTTKNSQQQIKYDPPHPPLVTQQYQQTSISSQRNLSTQPQEHNFNQIFSQQPTADHLNNVQQHYNYIQQPIMNYQNQGSAQKSNQQQPLQEQVRMFPEKETQAINIPYQDVHSYPNNLRQMKQYSVAPAQYNSVFNQDVNNTPMPSAAQYNQTLMPPTLQQNLQTTDQIWASQSQPQQVFRMTHSMPQLISQDIRTPQVTQSLYQQPIPAAFIQPSNLQYAPQGNIRYTPTSTPYQTSQQMFVPQPQFQQLPQFQQELYPQHHPQVLSQTRLVSIPQVLVAQNDYQYQTPYIQNSVPYIPQQALPSQQPMYYQRPSEPQQIHTPPELQQKSQHAVPVKQEPLVPPIIEPQQDSEPQQQIKADRKAAMDNLKGESVHALLQVESRFFKPNSIQLKRPTENVVYRSASPRQSAKKEDTVASLIVAEQEFFENGVLRDEYRTPVRYSETTKPRENQLAQPNPEENPTTQSQETSQPNEVIATNVHPPQNEQNIDMTVISNQSPQHVQQEVRPQQYPTLTQQELHPTQQELPQPQHNISKEIQPQQPFTPNHFAPPQQQYLIPQYSPQITTNAPQQTPVNYEYVPVDVRPNLVQQHHEAPHIPEEQTKGNIQLYTRTPNQQNQHNQNDPQFEQGDHKQEIAITEKNIEENPKEEPKFSMVRSPTFIRHSLYVANDSNIYAEGPTRTAFDTRPDERYFGEYCQV